MTAFTVVNYFGITKTAGVARILLALTLAALVTVLVATVGGGSFAPVNLGNSSQWFAAGVPGILQAAGLLFFAFAGYARIATMGEEVREPTRTIPRAISLALGIALVLYAVVGVALLTVLGPDQLAGAAPLTRAVTAGDLGG